tara:strand:+ start:115 stop:438 length:324 start_codon:yes stop_codon:yes gene_type:complete
MHTDSNGDAVLRDPDSDSDFDATPPNKELNNDDELTQSATLKMYDDSGGEDEAGAGASESGPIDADDKVLVGAGKPGDTFGPKEAEKQILATFRREGAKHSSLRLRL